MKKQKIRNITECAIFVAILAIISQIALPTGPVPITLQVLALSLTGYYLGMKKSTTVIVTYLLLGFVGVPVFSSFQGGIQALLSYTGGFILGFVPFVIFCAICNERRLGILLGIVGLLICHTIGILWYSYLSSQSIINSFVVVSLPYLIKDIILVVIGYYLASLVKKRI